MEMRDIYRLKDLQEIINLELEPPKKFKNNFNIFFSKNGDYIGNYIIGLPEKIKMVSDENMESFYDLIQYKLLP